jgi:hypothetical protein
VDGDELRVSSGDEQREKRIGRRFLTVEKRSEDVPVQMIDRIKRLTECKSKRFRSRNADDETADESGSARDRNRVEGLEAAAGAVERVFDGGREQRDVLPACNLRHDSTVLGVKRVLIRGHVRKHAAAVAYDSRRGVVARRFDSQNEHGNDASRSEA